MHPTLVQVNVLALFLVCSCKWTIYSWKNQIQSLLYMKLRGKWRVTGNRWRSYSSLKPLWQTDSRIKEVHVEWLIRNMVQINWWAGRLGNCRVCEGSGNRCDDGWGRSDDGERRESRRAPDWWKQNSRKRSWESRNVAGGKAQKDRMRHTLCVCVCMLSGVCIRT